MSKKKRKVSRLEFDMFRADVDECIESLGLQRYTIEVDMSAEPDADAWAWVNINEPQAVARITLNGVTDATHDELVVQLPRTAMHECLHILLSQYTYQASCRFNVNEDDLRAEEEKIIRTLEKLL